MDPELPPTPGRGRRGQEANQPATYETDVTAPAVSPQARVVFTPSGREVVVQRGTTVLDAARLGGVDLDSVCAARGICGRCQVVPTLGQFPKWRLSADLDSMSPWSQREETYAGRRELLPGRRLGCALAVLGDLVVDVPEDSQVHKQVVRKDLDLVGLTVDPIVDLHYVEIPAPQLGAEMSDERALLAALAADWGLEDVHVAPDVLAGIRKVLAADPGTTVAVYERRRVVAAWPGYVDRIAGAAIDIGSTTVAGYLCDLDSGALLATAGVMNPQIRFGEDLMSRVSYAMMTGGGAGELTAAVRGAVDELVARLARDAELARDRILDVVLVGNPIMHHLYLGFDPTPLGVAPFTLATGDPVTVDAGYVELDLPGATVTFGPCIAGHVGADTVGAILAEGPHRSDEVQLLVDVGTNAEIVLGNREGLYAASSPTGPALEGGEISCGMRAAAGAIERVRIDRDTLEPRFAVIGAAPWSDEPGFAGATNNLSISGVCGSGIVEVIGEMFLAGILDAQGRIVGELAARTDRIVAQGRTFAYLLHDGTHRLMITQKDVRAVQLAKAALRAGIDLLRERSGLHKIDSIRLAGAFGSHIDPTYAMVLGLIPDGPAQSAGSAGNASGVGAVRALLSAEQRRELAAIPALVTKIETATEPRFQELFVAAMGFPHSTEPTPHLATMVDLPPPGEFATHDAGQPGRRRRSRERDVT